MTNFLVSRAQNIQRNLYHPQTIYTYLVSKLFWLSLFIIFSPSILVVSAQNCVSGSGSDGTNEESALASDPLVCTETNSHKVDEVYALCHTVVDGAILWTWYQLTKASGITVFSSEKFKSILRTCLDGVNNLSCIIANHEIDTTKSTSDNNAYGAPWIEACAGVPGGNTGSSARASQLTMEGGGLASESEQCFSYALFGSVGSSVGFSPGPIKCNDNNFVAYYNETLMQCIKNKIPKGCPNDDSNPVVLFVAACILLVGGSTLALAVMFGAFYYIRKLRGTNSSAEGEGLSLLDNDMSAPPVIINGGGSDDKNNNAHSLG